MFCEISSGPQPSLVLGFICRVVVASTIFLFTISPDDDFNSDTLKTYVEKKGGDLQREIFLRWFVEAFVSKHIKSGTIYNLQGLGNLKLIQ